MGMGTGPCYFHRRFTYLARNDARLKHPGRGSQTEPANDHCPSGAGKAQCLRIIVAIAIHRHCFRYQLVVGDFYIVICEDARRGEAKYRQRGEACN